MGGEWQGALANVVFGLAGALVTWLVKDLVAAKRAKSKADISEGLVPEEKCTSCHAAWEAKLAAGDERMNVGAEVDAFVVTWLPVICEAIDIKPDDCKAMKIQAQELLNKVLNAGRNRTGRGKEVNHA